MDWLKTDKMAFQNVVRKEAEIGNLRKGVEFKLKCSQECQMVLVIKFEMGSLNACNFSVSLS